MILKKGTFAEFAQRVKTLKKQVIVYGAGVIGETIAPYWLHEYRLDEAVLCYADADSHKQGRSIQLASRAVPIESLEALTVQGGNYILLVTVSAFEPVVRSLEPLSGMEDTEVYFLPVMLLDMAHSPKKSGVIRTSDVPLIPKKIHYCWFSGNPIPEPLQKCISSWKQFCPDYEIIRWDESNYDINRYLHVKQAYEHKKWGFISDIARLEILYLHGGIYLDTDVELIRNLDDLLYQPGFCSVETWGTIGTGAGCGVQAGNPVIKAMLDFRKDTFSVDNNGQYIWKASGYYDTIPLLKMGLKLDGTTQTIAEGMMTVYSSEFFLPFNYISGETKCTKNTFSIHHYSGSWAGEQGVAERLKTQNNYTKFLKRLE